MRTPLSRSFLARWLVPALLLALSPLSALANAPALTPEQLHQLLLKVDERSRTPTDYRVVMTSVIKRDTGTAVREAQLFRRDREERLLLLFTAPKTEAGKGYLREESNLWSYDPNVGRWERRTERESIGGTESRRSDFDQTRYATWFDATYEGTEKVGNANTHRITLKVKEGHDVPFPVIKMWLDVATTNPIKREEYALSGKLLRTVLASGWKKVALKEREEPFWYPEELRLYDELNKGNSSTFKSKAVDMRALPANLFTKAWLESKSR
ncbi:outer membrane lipoprotein-sorting protein [Archangium sp.]|uniref:outer membrane lipoprotein-sorting protein n=1 Tax=Archangium sp. TaxID=1872627 RepID=UPI00286CA032|nr:outer membrane lipoprotein-sorting protein [Archangium sp.]